MKHKDEVCARVWGGGRRRRWWCWLSGGRSEVLYISKARACFPAPLSTSHRVCVSVCASAPGKPSIDTQLSTALLIQTLHRDHCASQEEKQNRESKEAKAQDFTVDKRIHRFRCFCVFVCLHGAVQQQKVTFTSTPLPRKKGGERRIR